MIVFKDLFYVLNHVFITNKKFAIHFPKLFINLIFNYKICKKYLDLVLNINDISLKEEIINLLWKSRTIPSDYYFLFRLHSDIEYERFSIFAKSLEIHEKLKKLKKSEIDFFSKGFSKARKQINIIASYPSFLAFNINLALIYNFFGIRTTIYYFHEEINLYTKDRDKIDIKKFFIIKNECLKISKKFKNIKFIFNDNKKYNLIIDKNLKNYFKLTSVKDITSYDYIITYKKDFKYEEIKHKILNKKLLKERYLSNLKFASFIFPKIKENSFWLIHNSNVGSSGILQNIINFKNCSFSSHEFRQDQPDKRGEYKNFKPIMVLKNKEVLNFYDKRLISNILKNRNANQIKLGSEIIEKNLKNNYKKEEEDIVYETFPHLKNFKKEKIFLFLSNILSESKYTLHHFHNVFDNFKDFLKDTIRFFNQSDLQLIIKCHPHEYYERHKYRDSLINIVNSENCKNVNLVFSDKISSYSLFNITENIIVYDTDMAVEMNYFQKKVITCANANYNTFDITFFPKNKSKYFNTIKKMSKNSYSELEKNNLFRINKENASLYWYYFTQEQYKNFPFIYGDSTNQLIQNFDYFFSKKCEIKSKQILSDLINYD
jgi:hypothetical protein